MKLKLPTSIEKLKSGPHKRDMIRWYKKRMRNERKNNRREKVYS